MKKYYTNQMQKHFILRRVFRAGDVSRSHLIKAFGMSTAAATRVMSDTLSSHGDILERKGYKLVKKANAACPLCASEEDLLRSLDSGNSKAYDIGLFENELPITYVSWTNSMPRQPGILQTIVTAIKLEKQLDIVYQGLRKGECPRNRKILPKCLEKMNDQWRVIAQEVKAPDFPNKVFVLPRILSATFTIEPKRIPLVTGYQDGTIDLPVRLNPKYTSEQKKVLIHELKIKDNTISIPRRSTFEFKRRYAEIAISEDAVWPPLVIK